MHGSRGLCRNIWRPGGPVYTACIPSIYQAQSVSHCSVPPPRTGYIPIIISSGARAYIYSRHFRRTFFGGLAMNTLLCPPVQLHTAAAAAPPRSPFYRVRACAYAYMYVYII